MDEGGERTSRVSIQKVVHPPELIIDGELENVVLFLHHVERTKRTYSIITMNMVIYPSPILVGNKPSTGQGESSCYLTNDVKLLKVGSYHQHYVRNVPHRRSSWDQEFVRRGPRNLSILYTINKSNLCLLY